MAALWAEFSEPEEATNRRGTTRRRLRLVARAAYARSSNEVLILDLSTTGLMLETSAPLSTGETIEVELPEAGPITARVIWRREAYYGCEFLTPAPVAAVSAALLRSAPRQGDLSMRATGNSTLSDRAPQAAGEPVNPGLALFVLFLLLVAVGTFMLALMTLPFSAH